MHDRLRFARALALALAPAGGLALGAGLAAPAAAQAVGAGRSLPPETQARVIVGLQPAAVSRRFAALSSSSPRDLVALQAQEQARDLSAAAGVALTAGRLLGERAMVLKAGGLGSHELAERLSRHADVAWAVPDRRKRAAAVPNDPLFAAGPASGQGPDAGQWYLRTPDATLQSATNFQQAWDQVSGRSSVVVAVLDSGTLRDHPDLTGGQLLQGRDFIADRDVANDGGGRDSDSSDPGDWVTAAENGEKGGAFENCGESDSSWHGTQVAGVIGASANNGLGMAGAAHGVRILPVRVLGKCGGYDSDIIAGMYWAAGRPQAGEPANATPARVLNLSLGGEGLCGEAYRSAVAEISAAPYHAVVVAAAGNSSGHAVGEPANCPGVLGIGGLRHSGAKSLFSDLGPEVFLSAPAGNCVNIAPGTPCLYPILTTSNSGTRAPQAGGSIWTDSYNITVGTSFSSPIVAAAAALVLSAQPGYTVAQVRDTLARSARPFPTSGSDNGPDDPSPVLQCRAPDGTDQLQCYCSVGLCGAGILDAAAAVADAVQKVPLSEGARQLMDFGQQRYPELFPGNPATQTWGPFAYRAYANGLYLGVVIHSDAAYRLNGVYLLGGVYGNAPVYVGQVGDFIVPSALAAAPAADRRRAGIRLR